MSIIIQRHDRERLICNLCVFRLVVFVNCVFKLVKNYRERFVVVEIGNMNETALAVAGNKTVSVYRVILGLGYKAEEE